MAVAFAIGMTGTTLPTPLYPLYQHAWHLSSLIVAVIFATYAFGVLAALIVAGPWSDQVGRRPILVGALAAAFISSLLFVVVYLAVSIPVLGLGFAVAAMGLRDAGITFALLVLLLSVATLGLLWRRRTHAAVVAG